MQCSSACSTEYSELSHSELNWSCAHCSIVHYYSALMVSCMFAALRVIAFALLCSIVHIISPIPPSPSPSLSLPLPSLFLPPALSLPLPLSLPLSSISLSLSLPLPPSLSLPLPSLSLSLPLPLSLPLLPSSPPLSLSLPLCSQSKEKMKRGSRRATIQLKGAIIGIDDEDDCTFTIRDQTRIFHFQGMWLL